ncbi:hypothetical protein JTE90_023136 [Oedothorax gibbosus]|uniref:Uncharacterized protein n=1 Tax=Oedothorax gibbosus TaxID=931172 RepID=A0AAV6UPM0_9ARAC|nr:hypothetical protein JTE90_023136 [Oedothorax gibbosus]
MPSPVMVKRASVVSARIQPDSGQARKESNGRINGPLMDRGVAVFINVDKEPRVAPSVIVEARMCSKPFGRKKSDDRNIKCRSHRQIDKCSCLALEKTTDYCSQKWMMGKL